jgi:hypothetical protein
MVNYNSLNLETISSEQEESNSKRIQPWDRYEWEQGTLKCVKITYTAIASVGQGKNPTVNLHPLGCENYNQVMDLFRVIRKDFKLLRWFEFSNLMSLTIQGKDHNRQYVLPGDLVQRPDSRRKDVFQVEKGYPSHAVVDQSLVLVTFIRRGRDVKILYAPLVTAKEKANRRINPARLKVA